MRSLNVSYRLHHYPTLLTVPPPNDPFPSTSVFCFPPRKFSLLLLISQKPFHPSRSNSTTDLFRGSSLAIQTHITLSLLPISLTWPLADNASFLHFPEWRNMRPRASVPHLSIMLCFLSAARGIVKFSWDRRLISTVCALVLKHVEWAGKFYPVPKNNEFSYCMDTWTNAYVFISRQTVLRQS